MLLLLDKMGSNLDVTNACIGCDRLALNRLVGKEVTMGCIMNIKGCKETILDREKDLEDLIDSYIGIDARDMYHEILQGYKDRLKIKTEDAAESEDRVNRLVNTIDEGRYNIFQILDDLTGEVDLPDLRRRLQNIAWELDY